MDEQERIVKLIKFLKSNTRSRRTALRELSNYGDNPLAVGAIVHALGDENSSAVRHLADSIVMELGEKAHDLILASLQHENRRIRSRIISSESLMKICGRAAVEPLINLLRHDVDDNVRSSAALTLGKIGDKRALDALITALDDVSHVVRLRAATALGQIGNAKAIPKLTARLMDKHPGVRACSAGALGKIGDANSLKPLRLALLRILTQMVESPEKLIKYQEEKRLKEQRYRERLKRDKRRKYYRELDKRVRISVGID